jgi:type I restriction enzyme S subunit
LFGHQIATKKQFRLVPGALIISRVQCWHQAYAIVGDVPINTIASTNYDQFAIAPEVDPRFFWWLSHSPSFTETVRSSAVGVVIEKMVFNRDKWLTKSIMLPPLPEQRRIVARIDELSIPINEATALREQARIECLELIRSAERRIWPIESIEGAPTLDEVTSFLARGRHSEQGESDHYLIKTQHVQQNCYVPTSLRLAPHVAARVHPEAIAKDGDILIACSAAGCLGRVARFKDDGRSASTDTHIAIARANPAMIEPDYLYAYLRGVQGQYQLRSRERGDWKREKISFRLTELNPRDLKMVPVPVPYRKEQLRIVSELKELEFEVKTLSRLQAETAAELDALLPSVLSKAFAGEL